MNILRDSIPVVAYHQVSSNNKITPELFRKQMEYLYNSGYKTVSLDEFYFYVTGKGENKLPPKKILITFDDGFADNYIHAYPILKEYGFSAVIFLITSRVSMSEMVRFNIDDAKNGDCTEDDLYVTNLSNKANADAVIKGHTEDFLTAAEIKKMYDDGVFDFESHTHFHAKHFTDNGIVDFFNPDSHWSALFESGGRYDYGMPLYKMDSAVTGKRFFDDKGLREYLIEHVEKNGSAEIFHDKYYKKALLKVADDYKAEHSLDERYESDTDFEKRVTDELMKSKEIISKLLDKSSEYLCWPWGKYSNRSVGLVQKCGFKGLFSLARGANRRGGDIYNIKRLEVKPNGIGWFKNRLDTYSSSLRSGLYGLVRR